VEFRQLKIRYSCYRVSRRSRENSRPQYVCPQLGRLLSHDQGNHGYMKRMWGDVLCLVLSSLEQGSLILGTAPRWASSSTSVEKITVRTEVSGEQYVSNRGPRIMSVTICFEYKPNILYYVMYISIGTHRCKLSRCTSYVTTSRRSTDN